MTAHPSLATPTTDGLRAWAVVAAATVAAAVGLGTVTSHGVLVASLAPLTIAGVQAGAVLVAVGTTLQFGLGPVAARLVERVGIVGVVGGAALAYGAGAAAAALAGSSIVGVLAYAVGTGVAGAAVLAPLFATVSGWCVRRRAAGVAILSAGNGIGALLLAPWLASSVEARGLTATWTIVAIGGTAVLLACAATVRTPPLEPAPSSDRPRVFRDDPALQRFYLAGVLAAMGVIATLAYLVPYAVELGFEPAKAALLLGATGAIGIVSRLAVSFLPPGRAFRGYRASQAGLAVSAVPWILAPGQPRLLLVFVVVFGLSAGLWAALAPLVLAEAYPDRLGSLLGVVYTSPAIGGAVGPLLAAGLLRVAPLRATGLLLAGCLTLAYRLLRPLRAPRAVVPALALLAALTVACAGGAEAGAGHLDPDLVRAAAEVSDDDAHAAAAVAVADERFDELLELASIASVDVRPPEIETDDPALVVTVVFADPVNDADYPLDVCSIDVGDPPAPMTGVVWLVIDDEVAAVSPRWGDGLACGY